MADNRSTDAKIRELIMGEARMVLTRTVNGEQRTMTVSCDIDLLPVLLAALESYQREIVYEPEK